MSTWNIRPLAIPDDFPRVAAILTAVNPEPVTVAELVEGANKPNGLWHRAVVTDDTGFVVGYGMVRRFPFEQEGRFFLKAYVDPAFRGRGAGGALSRHLMDWTATHNPVLFDTMTRENDPASVAFAERRGFVTFQHVFESTLNPHTFDETPFAGVVEAVQAAGIRFFTLAEDTSEEAARTLYELYARCAPDTPQYRLASYPKFEQWREWMFDSKTTCREAMILAADGDQVVGCTVMVKVPASGALYIDYTCVDRAYRDRHLALALKLVGIRVARALGVPYIRTDNDSNNGPMLAINRKLGFVPAPGEFFMARHIR